LKETLADLLRYGIFVTDGDSGKRPRKIASRLPSFQHAGSGNSVTPSSEKMPLSIYAKALKRAMAADEPVEFQVLAHSLSVAQNRRDKHFHVAFALLYCILYYITLERLEYKSDNMERMHCEKCCGLEITILEYRFYAFLLLCHMYVTRYSHTSEIGTLRECYKKGLNVCKMILKSLSE